MSLNSTKIVILAAGQGTRLRPLTDEIPKALVKFNHKAIIDYQMSAYHKNKLKDIYVVTGYKHEKFDDLELTKVVNDEYSCTNMVASLHKARHLFDGQHNILISYGDIIFESEVVAKLMSNCNKSISIIYDLNWFRLWSHRMENPMSDVESFRLDDNNDIIELGGKPNNIESIEGQYIGMIYVNREFAPFFFDLYENALKSNKKIKDTGVRDIYMTDYLQELIDRGVKVRGISINGGWLEIDSVKDLNSYLALLRNNELLSIIDLEKV